jgi:hypothetical protein
MIPSLSRYDPGLFLNYSVSRSSDLLLDVVTCTEIGLLSIPVAFQHDSWHSRVAFQQEMA